MSCAKPSFVEASSMPRVDLEKLRRGEPGEVNRLAEALGGCGFVGIKNHGVACAWVRSLYSQLEHLFALPFATKDRFTRPELGYQRGYLPLRAEQKPRILGGAYVLHDLKEAWQGGRSGNVFPP